MRRPFVTRGAWIAPFPIACLVFGFLGTGCRGQESQAEPIVPIRNMHDQPRYDAQEASAFFEDGRTMREPVSHAVPREVPEDLAVATGRIEGNLGPSGAWVQKVPMSVTQRLGGADKMMARGQERFGIYCSPCHGLTGAGNGNVAMRAKELGYAALVPPTLGVTPEGDDRLLHVPDGHLFGVISNGIRNMPAYRHNIPVRDRWAIVAYVRALQIRLANLPATTASADMLPETPEGDLGPHDHAEETL